MTPRITKYHEMKISLSHGKIDGEACVHAQAVLPDGLRVEGSTAVSDAELGRLAQPVGAEDLSDLAVRIGKILLPASVQEKFSVLRSGLDDDTGIRIAVDYLVDAPLFDSVPWEMAKDSDENWLVRQKNLSIVRRRSVLKEALFTKPEVAILRLIGEEGMEHDGPRASDPPARDWLTWVAEEDAWMDPERSFRDHEIGIFHFSGHGGSGGSILYNTPSRPETRLTVEMSYLAKYLGRPDFALFSACDSGTSSFGEAWSNSLIRELSREWPAVLGFRRPIRERLAKKFSGSLYEHLFSGYSLDQALQLARLSLDSTWDAAIPILYLAATGDTRLRHFRDADTAVLKKDQGPVKVPAPVVPDESEPKVAEPFSDQPPLVVQFRGEQRQVRKGMSGARLRKGLHPPDKSQKGRALILSSGGGVVVYQTEDTLWFGVVSPTSSGLHWSTESWIEKGGPRTLPAQLRGGRVLATSIEFSSLVRLIVSTEGGTWVIDLARSGWLPAVHLSASPFIAAAMTSAGVFLLDDAGEVSRIDPTRRVHTNVVFESIERIDGMDFAESGGVVVAVAWGDAGDGRRAVEARVRSWSLEPTWRDLLVPQVDAESLRSAGIVREFDEVTRPDTLVVTMGDAVSTVDLRAAQHIVTRP